MKASVILSSGIVLCILLVNSGVGADPEPPCPCDLICDVSTHQQIFNWFLEVKGQRCLYNGFSDFTQDLEKLRGLDNGFEWRQWWSCSSFRTESTHRVLSAPAVASAIVLHCVVPAIQPSETLGIQRVLEAHQQQMVGPCWETLRQTTTPPQTRQPTTCSLPKIQCVSSVCRVRREFKGHRAPRDQR